MGSIPITQAAPECLQSFYGAGNAKREQITILYEQPDPEPETLKERARKNRNATAKSMISPGERPQEIYTPQVLIDAILKVWPHVALDPCSGPGSIVGAIDSCYLPPSATLGKTGKVKVEYLPVGGDSRDGLTTPWVDYTYVNPPYKLLKDWLMKGRVEGQDEGREVIMLVPARGHRTWFRDVVATCNEICDLNPVKFVGYKSTFPAPLLALYWGVNTSLFREAFSGKIGDCR